MNNIYNIQVKFAQEVQAEEDKRFLDIIEKHVKIVVGLKII